MYLKRDITGAASRVEKGKAGDKVIVLGNHIEMVLVENKGERFFVFPEDLTENYFESYEKNELQNKGNPPPKTIKKGTRGI